MFLDYDGVLTPIVDRPEDARISVAMRDVVRALAQRTTVCVVSGRDRLAVQGLMGIDDLVVAGSHGFDIWSPQAGTLEHEAAGGSEQLIGQVTARLREQADGIRGAVVEPKRFSVAVHYRLTEAEGRDRIARVVEALLAEFPDELKMTPGKMVYELLPKVDWDKGRAVLYLIDALGLDLAQVVPVYLGDDRTDEDAFRALRGKGIGIFVGSADDPEAAGQTIAADYVLASTGEVQRFLDGVAR